MPAIRACLEYKHSYVRRNAVMAIFTIFKNFNFLIPDAPELIANFLEREQDMSCKRNAFMMLIHADQDRALNYLSSCIEQVNSFGDILQLVIVELIYKVCHANPSERARFIRSGHFDAFAFDAYRFQFLCVLKMHLCPVELAKFIGQIRGCHNTHNTIKCSVSRQGRCHLIYRLDCQGK
jgi:hypothetical protein